MDNFRKNGYIPLGSTPDEQLRQYQTAAKFWTDAARAANFTPQQ